MAGAGFGLVIPDRSFGADQPGGWAFNLMPFTEEDAGYKFASDGNPNTNTQRQLDAIRDVIVKPLSLIGCPSRRNGSQVDSKTDWTGFITLGMLHQLRCRVVVLQGTRLPAAATTL